MAARTTTKPRRRTNSIVWLHTKSTSNSQWASEGKRLFSRIPEVGECVALTVDSHWYKVTLVVHCPFKEADCDAEVYAIKVDHVRETLSAGSFSE
jgi:hypothetical protein